MTCTPRSPDERCRTSLIVGPDCAWLMYSPTVEIVESWVIPSPNLPNGRYTISMSNEILGEWESELVYSRTYLGQWKQEI